MTDRISHLRQGQRFRAQVASRIRGQRVFRTVERVASRDQDVESFCPSIDGIAQDRVFVEHPATSGEFRAQFGRVISAPELVVSGTIRLEADQ